MWWLERASRGYGHATRTMWCVKFPVEESIKFSTTSVILYMTRKWLWLENFREDRYLSPSDCQGYCPMDLVILKPCLRMSSIACDVNQTMVSFPLVLFVELVCHLLFDWWGGS